MDSFCDAEAGEVEHVVSADGTSGFALTGGNDAHAVLCKAASALWPGESRAEAVADAWARTHHKASLVPLGNDTYRVVGAMRRSAVTGRYLTSADKGE